MKQGTLQIIKRLHSEGLALSDLGKHKEALARFERIIKLEDRDNFAWHRKGIELNFLKKYKEALDCFDRAIMIKRNDQYAWNHRGVALRELGRYDEALQSCNKAVRINSKYPFAWYTKGSILQHLGDLAGAKDCFQNAVRFAPDNEIYRESLAEIDGLTGQSDAPNQTSAQLHHDGIALSRLGKHEESLAQFEKAIKLNPEDNVAWHRKGIELNALEKYSEAMECFERAIVIDRNDQYAWNYRGEALRELGREEEAFASFNEAIITNENYPFAWYNKGIVLQYLGDYTEAKICLERAFRLAPNAPWWDGGGVDNEKLYRKRLAEINDFIGKSEVENETIQQLHHDGLMLNKLGKHAEALVKFDKATKSNPEDNVSWHRKGIELNWLGEYESAIECFERAIRINSRDKFAWNHRALSLCRLGNYKDAITSCNEAIKIDDTYPFAWCNRAVISAHLEDFEDFQKCFRRARQLDPKGLNNQFFAEHLPKIEYKDLLSRSKGDVKRSSYYCCELCLVHLQIKEMPEALKYALDLRNYANEKVKAILTPLIEELEFRINGGAAVTEDLIERADVILHQVKMGW